LLAFFVDAMQSVGVKLLTLENKFFLDTENNCSTSSLASDFPGKCASAANAIALAQCLHAGANCRLCRALNAIDGLSVNCDAYDEGIASGYGSCP
jgi:hypothetical protein